MNISVAVLTQHRFAHLQEHLMLRIMENLGPLADPRRASLKV